jgi:hypothetical protein
MSTNYPSYLTVRPVIFDDTDENGHTEVTIITQPPNDPLQGRISDNSIRPNKRRKIEPIKEEQHHFQTSDRIDKSFDDHDFNDSLFDLDDDDLPSEPEMILQSPNHSLKMDHYTQKDDRKPFLIGEKHQQLKQRETIKLGSIMSDLDEMLERLVHEAAANRVFDLKRDLERQALDFAQILCGLYAGTETQDMQMFWRPQTEGKDADTSMVFGLVKKLSVKPVLEAFENFDPNNVGRLVNKIKISQGL